MIKKNKVVFIIFISIILLISSRNILLKSAVHLYLKNKLDITSEIGKFSLLPLSLNINDAVLQNQYFKCNIAKLRVDFSFKNIFAPAIKNIHISTANIDIGDMDDFTKLLTSNVESRPRAAHDSNDTSFDIYLDNMSVSISSGQGLNLSSTLSFKGEFSKGKVSRVDLVRIDSFVFKTKEVSTSLKLEPDGEGYALVVDSFKYKDKSLKNLAFRLSVDENTLLLRNSPFSFLGSDGYIEAEIKYSDYANICMRLALENASFGQAGDFFGLEGSVYFDGPFTGELGACLRGAKLEALSGTLSAEAAGTIKIEKELALDFLKRHLDEKSYKALVDSFRHYTYNEGTISISKQQEVISAHLDFNSESAGRRDIVVNYHMPGGGQ
jgi:hypothetical protein